MLKATDLSGVQEDLALALISYAVSVAPCLDSLPAEGTSETTDEYRKRALSVLRRAAAKARGRSDENLRGQRVGTASAEYGDVGSYFSRLDEAALAGICTALGADAARGAGPVGSFPRPGIVTGLWPEEVE